MTPALDRTTLGSGRARGALALAALLFSTGGAAVKAIDLDGWQVASFRSLVAAAALFLLLPESRRFLRRDVLATGFFFAVTMILYVSANKYTSAANSIFLQSTAPLYLLVLSPWLLKEAVRRADLLLTLLLAAGMSLFFVGTDAPSPTAQDPSFGNLLGAASGATWAMTLLGLRRLGRVQGGGAPAAVMAGSVIAGALSLPFALPVAAVSATDLLLVLYLGVVQIGVAYLFLTRGLRHVPALEASLLLLLEPVFNPLFAFLFHRELPNGWSFAGCAVIFAATVGRVVIDACRARPARQRGAA